MTGPARLRLAPTAEGRPLAEVMKQAGIAGCGGAGFPAYAKYPAPAAEGARPILVTNAQESEPGYFIDKWLHRERPEAFFALYEHLLATCVDKVIIGAKMKDRAWFEPLEEVTGGAVLDCTGKNRHDPRAIRSRYLFCYTDDRYAFGKETALLLVVAQAKIPPGELPGQHGFIVNNSQTLWNIHQALTEGAPVTRKYVHVYGESPRHVFLDAPVGTPLDVLFAEAGIDVDEVQARGFVVVEGGPGWFHRVDPHTHSVTRRTNAILLIDPAFRDPSGKDVLPKGSTPGYPRHREDDMQKAPAPPLAVSRVRVQLVDNKDIAAVKPAVPVVAVGDAVKVGDVIARADEGGFSLPCHASIDGVVTAVTEDAVEISWPTSSSSTTTPTSSAS